MSVKKNIFAIHADTAEADRARLTSEIQQLQERLEAKERYLKDCKRKSERVEAMYRILEDQGFSIQDMQALARAITFEYPEKF